MKQVNCLDRLKDLYARIIVESAINMHIGQAGDFTFVQIGAFDGIRNDIIRKFILKYKWKGVLVEPVKHLFDTLVNNYKGQDNLYFENSAIAEKNEIKDFYRIKQNSDNLAPYYEELGTLNPEILLKNKGVIPDIENYIISEKVRCIRFSDLLEKYNIKKVDLLQIDTEGYDYRIIKTIDFVSIEPKVIIYEHKHLTEGERIGCANLLKAKGYAVCRLGVDTLAYKYTEKKARPYFMMLLYLINATLNIARNSLGGLINKFLK